MSRDAAEVEYGHIAPTRGEHREDGPPDGSRGNHAGETTHAVAALVERAADLVEPVKPRLRGWLHAAMVPAALIAGVVLICLARTPQAAVACAVYSVTAWLLFATSAIY
ncbi:hemolysin III family protein, partial [Streptomyces sp. NPDC005281]|uniref:hemolysin III family protein n=1 Tax=Streptomyces sp. NPDC005281 TaxID=3155712 RepID=UPI0033BDCB22